MRSWPLHKSENTLSTAGNCMTSSEMPSPERLLEKEASPAVLGGRVFWKRSGAFKCLEIQGLGHPSRTLEGNCRKRSESVSGVFPEFLRNFLRKVPAVLGVWPNKVLLRELCNHFGRGCMSSSRWLKVDGPWEGLRALKVVRSFF